MSKHNQNRGRKRPKHKPSQRRSAEKNQSEVEVAGLTRRKVLGIGTVTLVAAALGHHFLRDDEMPHSLKP